MKLNHRGPTRVKEWIGQLESLTNTATMPRNRHWICNHHHNDSTDYATKTPLKSIGSKLAPLTPLKGSASRNYDMRAAANLRSAAMNSLDWTGSTSKNAQRLLALKVLPYTFSGWRSHASVVSMQRVIVLSLIGWDYGSHTASTRSQTAQFTYLCEGFPNIQFKASLSYSSRCCFVDFP